MFSARDERHSLLATLWFNIAHYAIRPWPWILTALASVILYPGLADPETGYIKVMIDHMPPSLRGLMLAGFAAAYMSAIATGAGTGGVLLLRWYWWRVNAWSEVVAMGTAFVVSVALQAIWKLDSDNPVDFAWIMIITVGITTAAWLAATFLTAPESNETLVSFYRRTRPSRSGWGPVAALAPDVKPAADGLNNLGCWLAGCLMIYMALFGLGKVLFKETALGVAMLTLAAAAGYYIYRDLSKRGWSSIAE